MVRATPQRIKEHNRRLILRTIFTGEADNRAALSLATGLAKPTVSDIVSELIDEGFIAEGGRGQSTESGGKRPRLLQFCPQVQQIIGVSINDVRAYGVLASLDGTIIAQHHALLNEAHGDEALTILYEVINGLIAQLEAPLLCISIGTPGIVLSDQGQVKASPVLGWYDLNLAETISQHYQVPTYVGNNTELATRAQFAHGTSTETCNLVTIFVNTSVEVGIAFNGDIYHHSGDLGLLRVGDPSNQYNDPRSLTHFLGWKSIKNRVHELREFHSDTILPERITFLHIREGLLRGDSLCYAIHEEIAAHLAQVFAWITGLIRPDQIVLAGSMAELGPALIEHATALTTQLVPAHLVDAVIFSVSEDLRLSATGTITLGLHKELGIL